MKCQYCEAAELLIECITCGKCFCNSRSASSISHIVFHLVKAKHKSIRINGDIKCRKCGEDNLFKLLENGGKIFCNGCSSGKMLVEERCLTIVKSPEVQGRRLTKQQMAEMEERNVSPLPHVKPRFEAKEYVEVFSSLIEAECRKEREIKESMRQENVFVRWEKMKYCYFYFQNGDSELKINVGDEIRLTHKSGLVLHGFVSGETFSEELKVEIETPGDYPRSGYTVEYLWRGVCYERMVWALKKLYSTYKREVDRNKRNRNKDDGKKLEDKGIDEGKDPDKKKSMYGVEGDVGVDRRKGVRAKKSLDEGPSIFEYILKGHKEGIGNFDHIFSSPNLPKLNASQEVAVRAALGRKVTLIQGPPGTGKTLVSSAIVYNLVRHYGGKVLVVAPSNTAVDQLTLKIHKTGLRVLRVMSRRREYGQSDVSFLSLHENLRELQEGRKRKDEDHSRYDSIYNDEVNESLKKQLLNQAEVITCTCVTSGQKMFNRFKFHCVLIDEAVQSTEPLSLIPLVYGCKKLVLVGDHKQLGPTILCKKVAQAGFKQSLFERLISIGVVPYMLSVQYRMDADLCEWPSEMFYNGELLTGGKNFCRFDLGIPVNFFYVCYGREEVSASGTSFVNQAEALYCESIIRHLFKCGVTESQIGVITPYEGQRSYILNRIFGAEPGNLEISNVDGFQGREKDFIIVSLVRSNLYQGIGFVGDKRRMNVTLTRAKHGLVIIGNPMTLMKHDMWGNLLSFYDRKGLVMEGPLHNLKRVIIKPPKLFDFKEISKSLMNQI
ncbi:INVOLVED IN mRNA DECAY CONTROL (DNA2/NAM7 HELICASE FAMILY) [Encephalitozoon cuniculi GB-M1]|uniref:INVOLVED IN mRNA DECAY CONTROL (DNA2/NAM7 HELICASE FAMILY) n=2 Tax=Encephalitozoon cuniculi TaxID=6035 RepID=Q8SR02_ENCCU|nr:superfamily I DNA/RNA helicase [Encephalitozoon cuniculi GB-M1]KMV65318.1 superfamily I DNA/RNA helicase [Encephalitozoon cuniculi EcunIII-L]UYI26630.1 regulator of nonsense transcripts 1-like protein [Encephalitozoon cuniculi]CAD25885.2 INVOLVED IN mRNA DECAY CONTROL (DNA2/NAM7 HELICASE FAMILY) [Encephalitozoon cuniculi GB-M1]